MDNTNLVGRNKNEIQFINEVKCIKKSLIGNHHDRLRRQNNLLVWEKNKNRALNSPELLFGDSSKGEYFYRWIEDSKTVQDILQEKISFEFSKNIYDIFMNIAYDLAIIHKGKVISQDGNLNDIKVLVRPLIALNSDEYAEASGGELEFLSLLQQDIPLIECLMSYSTKKEYTAMIHGDVRLDQFLYTIDNKVWIIDFEEYCYGDILKDLGGIIGSILFISYLNIFGSNWVNNDELVSDSDISNYLMEKEKSILNEIVPLINMFIQEYSKVSGLDIDYNLLSMNIGSFLIERIFSRSKLSFRLSAIDKAIAGIGREFVLSSDKLTNLLNS